MTPDQMSRAASILAVYSKLAQVCAIDDQDLYEEASDKLGEVLAAYEKGRSEILPDWPAELFPYDGLTYQYLSPGDLMRTSGLSPSQERAMAFEAAMMDLMNEDEEAKPDIATRY